MKKITIAVVVALLPTMLAADGLPKKPTQAPPPRQTLRDPCAAYGPGFVKVEGSSTRVKVGGCISVAAGRSR
jgi:hypothetical protein